MSFDTVKIQLKSLKRVLEIDETFSDNSGSPKSRNDPSRSEKPAENATRPTRDDQLSDVGPRKNGVAHSDDIDLSEKILELSLSLSPGNIFEDLFAAHEAMVSWNRVNTRMDASPSVRILGTPC